MKQRLAIAVVLVSIPSLVLFACGDSTDTDDSGTKDTGTPDTTVKPDTSVGVDSGTDGATDTGIDSTLTDTGTDTSVTDTGTSDAGYFKFMVLRMGGTPDAGLDAALTTSSTAAFLEERQSNDGTVLRVIALPTTDAGSNPLTLAGSSTTEGSLTRSVDGKFVVVAGYATPPGTSSFTNVNRVVGLVNASGAIDTNNALYVFTGGSSIRGAASADGGQFWLTGEATGVLYLPYGTDAATTVENTSVNNRTVNIFGGQLYGSTSSGTTYRVYSIGTGLPTTTGQTIAQVAGDLAGTANNNSFVFFDLSGSVTGLDTVYIADQRGLSDAGGGGVSKWINPGDGGTWTLAATFNDKLSGGACRQLTAEKVGSDIHIICSTSEDPSRLIRYVDVGGTSTTATGTVLATALPFTLFKGVSLSPQ